DWLDLPAYYARIYAPRVGGSGALGGVVHGAIVSVGDCPRLAALGVRGHQYRLRGLGPCDVRARSSALAAGFAPSGENRPIRIGQSSLTPPAGTIPNASGAAGGLQEKAPSRVPVGRRTRLVIPVRRERWASPGPGRARGRRRRRSRAAHSAPPGAPPTPRS